VAGLIDFGDACGGRPLDDMATLCRDWPDVDRAALAGTAPVLLTLESCRTWYSPSYPG